MFSSEIAAALIYILVADLIYIAIRLVRRKRGKVLPWAQELFRLLLVSYVVGVAGVLLLPKIDAGFSSNTGKPYLEFMFPDYSAVGGLNLIPLRTIGEQFAMIAGGNPFGIINLLVNCCLFVPFPVLLGLCFPQLKYRYRFLIPFVTILVCEAIQPFCGRSTDIDDVILNTAGVLAGLLISAVISRICARAAARRDISAPHQK